MNKLKDVNYLKKILYILTALIAVVIFILIYNLFNSGYTIKLEGSNEIVVYLDEEYVDPGYIAFNKKGENVTSKVKVIGNVNTSVEGTYQITYKIGTIKVYRNVVVKYNLENDIVIRYDGDNPLYVLKDNDYTFDDCYAFDKIDGDITSKIVVDNKIDFQQLGEYEVVYSVTNSRGVKKSITRKIIVYDIDYTLNEDILNNKVVVTMQFDKTYYQKVKLPDGTFSEEETVSYTFEDNGEYAVEIYDKYNYVKKIKIVISKIDKISPAGSCTVNLYDETSKIVVNANDNQGIKGYIYKYGNKQSVINSSNEFSYSEMVDNVSVIIYDNANNNIEITCKVNDLSTKYQRTYITQSGTYNYKLYIPSTLTKRNKLPLVIFMHGASECGSNINKLEANSFPKYIKEGSDYNFVMVAPQMPSNSSYTASKLKILIDDIISKYPIDTERIVITGFSLGGMATYDMVKKYPNFFASAMPLAAHTDYNELLLQTDIWAFHGKDATYERDKKVMDKVILGNSNSKFTTYNAPHNITDLVYKDSSVIEWIMSKRRKQES